MARDPILDLFGEDPEMQQEIARVRALRGDPARAQRLMRLGTVAAISSDQGLRGIGDNLYRTGAVQEDRYNQAAEEAYTGLKQTREQRARDAEEKRRWEAEQARLVQQHRDNMGLQWSQERRQAAKDAAELKKLESGGDWKVRVDPYGNPLGWMNDRGDFMTPDRQFFPAPGSAPRGSGTASVAATAAGGPAAPTAGSAGLGGGGRTRPTDGLFGLPAAPFGGQAANAGPRSVGPTQIDTGPQVSPEQVASMRQGRMRILPAEQQNAYANALKEVSKLPELISQVEQNTQYFGVTKDLGNLIPGQPGTVMGVAGDVARNIQDSRRAPAETEIRSRVYNQAYTIIHALAGAALSTGERQRLLQFLPGPNDPAEKIIGNLRAAYQEAQNTIDATEGMAGVPTEYRTRLTPLPERGRPGAIGGGDEIIDLPPRRR